MNWRLSSKEFTNGKGDRNKSAMHHLVTQGKSIGIMGIENGRALVWCAVAPRIEYPRLTKSRSLYLPETGAIWSITCIYIEKHRRGAGLSTKIISEALHYAIQNGAEIIEAYPYDVKGENWPAPFVWTGLVSSYLKTGFKEISRKSPTRPVMRFTVK